MQITISRKVLAGALAELAPLAGKNKVLPVLNNIKFVTKGNKIRLQTTDGDTSIRKYIEAESIDQDGEFLVDCASLNAFVGKIKLDVLSLVVEENTLVVKHGDGKATFPISSTENFIEPLQEEKDVEIVLNAKTLAAFVSIARNFVSTDDFRAVLKPIRAIIDNDTFYVCATDTRKMFTDSVMLECDNCDVQWFIDPSVFSALIKACKGQEKAIVKITDRNVSYRIGATTIYHQQIQGNYPNYKRVIPQSHSISVVCDKYELIDVLQRASLFLDVNNLIKISISSLSMDVQAENLGKLQKSMETLSCSSNHDITFGASSQILLDCINACESDEITIELNDPSHPIVLKDNANPNRIALCMPMILINPQ